MKYFKLESKIQELRHYSEVGIDDVKNTGLVVLDEYVGLKKGYPIFMAGNPGAGKTEFCFEILMNTSILYGWKHFIYCGEGGNIEHIYHDLIHKYLQKPYKNANEAEKIKAEYFISQHFIIANHDKDFTIKEFYSAIDEIQFELNIKFDTTVFDPFNDLTDESDKFGGRDDKYLSYALKQARISSKNNNRIDILITHTANVAPVTDKETGKRYTPHAMAGEWSNGKVWERRGFLMILIHRPQSFLKDEQGMPYAWNETHIHIQKAKPKGISQIGVRPIFFDKYKNRYYCFEGSQQLYSCETMQMFNPNYNANKGLNPSKNYYEIDREEISEPIEPLPF